MTDHPTQNPDKSDWQSWLKAPMTITSPRWMFVAAGAGAVLLLLAALD